MQPIPLFVCVFLIEYTNSKSKTTQFLINNKNYIMNTTKSTGVETVNSFITPKGMQRTLQVEVFENGNVDIDFTIKGTTLVKYNGKGREVTVPDGIEKLEKEEREEKEREEKKD